MTTPAQYEAAIRKLEEVLSFVGGFNPPMLLHEEDRPALESALAIVREAREDTRTLLDVWVQFSYPCGQGKRWANDGGFVALESLARTLVERGVLKWHPKMDWYRPITPEVSDAR